MPLVIEKILRAIVGLLLFVYFSKNLDIENYNKVIFDSFTLGIVTTVGLLSYRPFVFLNGRPRKVDIYFVISAYSIGSIILLFLDNQWWYTVYLLPLSKSSFYLEKLKPKYFYPINYFTILLSGVVALYFPFFFFLLIVPNLFSGLYSTIVMLFNKTIDLEGFDIKNLTKFSIPLLINALLISVYTKLDVFLIESMINDSHFKMDYFNAVKVVDYAIMLPVVYVSYSFRYWGINNTIKSYLYDFRFVLLGSSILAFLSFLSVYLIDLVFTIDVYAFRIYSIAIPFVVFNSIRNNVLLLTDLNWKVTVFSVISVILNFILSISMFHYYGNYSFLYGTIVTQIVLALFSIKIVANNKNLIMFTIK